MLFVYLSMLETDEQKDKFERIYRSYAGLMYRVAYSKVKEKDVVEDIVHDTLVKLIEKIDIIRVENERELRNFICIFTERRAIDFLRKSKRMRDDEQKYVDMQPSVSEDLEKIAIDEIMFAQTLQRLEALDERYRIPLELRVIGYSTVEIARLLDMNPQTVRVRIHRAKQKLLQKGESDDE